MEKEKRKRHDQIFKTLFREFFKEFIEGFLPDVAAELDFSTVKFLDKETFTDLNRGRFGLMDLVAQVNTISGDEEYILLHTEFESKRPQKHFPERMFKYLCQLFLRFGKPIIPIVIFSDDAKWRTEVPDTFIMSFKNREYLRFNFHAFKLKHMKWKDYVDSNNPLIYALMAKMEYDRRDIVRLKTDFLRLVLKSEKNPARRQVLVEFIENYIILRDDELEKFTNLIETKQEFREIKEMITVYEERGILKGIQEGIQEGIREGIREGIEKGRLEIARNDVIEVLELKFGKTPDQIREKILKCNDLHKLKNALKTAILAADINEFQI